MTGVRFTTGVALPAGVGNTGVASNPATGDAIGCGVAANGLASGDADVAGVETPAFSGVELEPLTLPSAGVTTAMVAGVSAGTDVGEGTIVAVEVATGV